MITKTSVTYYVKLLKSAIPSNVQHIWPPWYGSRSHRPTFSGVGHLYIPSTMSLYQNNANLTLSMPEQGKEMAECTQLCAILLISNLRNLQYLASLSIPMPQFEVFATSMYLGPWLNTQKSSLDPVDAWLGEISDHISLHLVPDRQTLIKSNVKIHQNLAN